ncbi:hypothetical protein OSTOST_06635 [Ostertagia ostertagi]
MTSKRRWRRRFRLIPNLFFVVRQTAAFMLGVQKQVKEWPRLKQSTITT